MSIHHLPVHEHRRTDKCLAYPPAKLTALSNALSITQRSPGWNNRKPDIVRVQLDACTLLAVPYRRWAWRRYELKIADARRQEA